MKDLTVTFKVNYGSEYQEDFFIRMLQVMLNTLKIHMEQSHKENKIIYKMDFNDGYKITKK